MHLRPATTLADASRILTTPGLPLAVHQDHWCAIKAARGQPVRIERLRPCHLRAAAPDATDTVAALDAARARTAVTVRNIILRELRAAAGLPGGAA